MSGARTAVPDSLRVLYSFGGTIGAPGIGWTAWNQVRALVDAGHEVHLVTAKLARSVPGVASVTYSLTLFGLDVPHRALGRLRAYSWHDRVAARVVRRVHPDVVHVWPQSGVATMAAARALGVPAVRECPNTHTAHAWEQVAREYASLGLTPPAGASHTADPRRLAVEQREWDAAAALLVPSEAVADSFRSRGFPDERLLGHQYGCTVDRPIVRHDADREFTAVFLGRCEPRKGLHYALQAWKRSAVSQHGRFLIYGRFAPDYEEYLGDLLSLPGVEVKGFTDDPIDVLLRSDVLLLPTIEEGSALVTYEAQVTGCVPLVSTAAGALLDHDIHGLVHDTGDVAMLARQLDELSGNPGYLDRLRRAAMAHAPRLSWRAASDRLVAAYRTVIARDATTVPQPAGSEDVRREELGPEDMSLIVCTRERPQMLANALASIRAQCHPAIEVIVVDSASTTAATRDVALAAGFTYVRSDVRGLSIARNVGLRTSERSIVIYTDDDCEAEPGWHDVMAHHFADPRVGCVSGQMNQHDESAPDGSLSTFTRVVQGLDAGHGALMAFRRDLVLGLGGFDDVLGAGRHLAGAEDLDMFCRVLESGATVVHDPACTTRHVHTRDDDDFAHLMRGYGLGLGALANKWWRARPPIGAHLSAVILRRAARQLVRERREARSRQGAQALLKGILSGFAIGARTPMAGRRFVDVDPPAPITLTGTTEGTLP